MNRTAKHSLSFKVSKADAEWVHRIVTRALALVPALGGVLELTMDLTAAHANGCPMDFEALYYADDFNLLHDVGGIRRHIDRSSGELKDCFRPRFAKPSREMAALPVVAERVRRAHSKKGGLL